MLNVIQLNRSIETVQHFFGLIRKIACRQNDLTYQTEKMLDVMSEYEDAMDRSQNTDLCVLLIVKNCDYMTCEIVVSLIDFIFEKNMFVCRDFLFWLDFSD